LAENFRLPLIHSRSQLVYATKVPIDSRFCMRPIARLERSRATRSSLAIPIDKATRSIHFETIQTWRRQASWARFEWLRGGSACSRTTVSGTSKGQVGREKMFARHHFSTARCGCDIPPASWSTIL
jgi:hypothetical protein